MCVGSVRRDKQAEAMAHQDDEDRPRHQRDELGPQRQHLCQGLGHGDNISVAWLIDPLISVAKVLSPWLVKVGSKGADMAGRRAQRATHAPRGLRNPFRAMRRAHNWHFPISGSCLAKTWPVAACTMAAALSLGLASCVPSLSRKPSSVGCACSRARPSRTWSMRAICSMHIASAHRAVPRPERLRAKERLGGSGGRRGGRLVAGRLTGWLAGWLTVDVLAMGARAGAMARESR